MFGMPAVESPRRYRRQDSYAIAREIPNTAAASDTDIVGPGFHGDDPGDLASNTMSSPP
jgi:hypothetical protein